MRGFARFLARWSLGGALLGGGIGLVLLLISLVGGRQAWAAMLLLAGVLSWPAGLWTFDLTSRAIQAGVEGMDLAILVVGPACNGLALGAVVGAMVWFGGGR